MLSIYQTRHGTHGVGGIPDEMSVPGGIPDKVSVPGHSVTISFPGRSALLSDAWQKRYHSTWLRGLLGQVLYRGVTHHRCAIGAHHRCAIGGRGLVGKWGSVGVGAMRRAPNHAGPQVCQLLPHSTEGYSHNRPSLNTVSDQRHPVLST